MKTDALSGELSPSVRAEAAAWVARLHSSGRTRALEIGLRNWLQADPAHARAFEVATEAWEIGGSIPSGALPRISHQATRSASMGARIFSPPRLAFVAALCTVLVGTLLYQQLYKPAVSTDIGEQRMLTLEDGTRIFLNTNTRLMVRQDETSRRVQLESGEALFDVAKNPQRPFIVTAGNREVVALGTAFVVKRGPQQLTVTLMEGKVAVSPVPVDPKVSIPSYASLLTEVDPAASVDAVVLTPGQRLTFGADNAPKLDRPSLDDVTAWRRGEVILDKTRLQDAVEELNRYSVVKLVIDDAATADIPVSGVFRAGDSARFAQAVAETYQLQIAQHDRRIVLSASPD